MIRQDQSRATVQDLPFGVKSQESILATNKVLKNTYMLLSMTLLWSALTAYLSMVTGFGRDFYISLLIASFASIFLVHFTAKSAWGLLSVFLFTGLMGATLGPILAIYLTMENGSSIVMQALGGTGVIFFALSGYVLTSKKDFSFMGGFLFVGLVVAVIASIANIFMGIEALDLAISAVIVLIMSGFILFDTSRLVNGGETNYIRATVGLYLNIFNLFLALLRLLGVFNND